MRQYTIDDAKRLITDFAKKNMAQLLIFQKGANTMKTNYIIEIEKGIEIRTHGGYLSQSEIEEQIALQKYGEFLKKLQELKHLKRQGKSSMRTRKMHIKTAWQKN